MQTFLIPLVIVAGALQALGNSMNSALRDSLRNPWLSSIVSFGLIIPFFVLAFAIMPRPLPSSNDIANMPWWAPLGGVAGAFAVYMGLVFVSKIGAGAFNGTLITANIVASLVIDHYGLLRMPQHPLGLGRIAGGALMIGGIILISKA